MCFGDTVSLTLFGGSVKKLLLFMFLNNNIFPQRVGNRPSMLPNTSTCGFSFMPTERVVGGDKTNICNYPWMVQLVTHDSTCGGTIINSRYVLTAAHCCDQKKSMHVVIGQTRKMINLKQKFLDESCDIKPQIIEVEEFIIHPWYTPQIWNSDDIALARLMREVKFTGALRPICLPLIGDNLRNGDKTVSAGWGRTERLPNKKNIKFPILREINSEVKDDNKCRQTAAMYHRTLEKHYICVKSSFDKGVYKGDSGGPLFRRLPHMKNRWVQIGVAVYVGKGIHDMYMRVHPYLIWIQNSMEL